MLPWPLVMSVDRCLYVGNINSDITESLLYELFLQAGPLEDVTVKDNFAFVTYEDEESVLYACSLFDGLTLYGTKIVIRPRQHSKYEKSNISVVPPMTSRLNDIHNNYHSFANYKDCRYEQKHEYSDLCHNSLLSNSDYRTPYHLNLFGGTSLYTPSQPTPRSQYDNYRSNRRNYHNFDERRDVSSVAPLKYNYSGVDCSVIDLNRKHGDRSKYFYSDFDLPDRRINNSLNETRYSSRSRSPLVNNRRNESRSILNDDYFGSSTSFGHRQKPICYDNRSPIYDRRTNNNFERLPSLLENNGRFFNEQDPYFNRNYNYFNDTRRYDDRNRSNFSINNYFC